MYCRVYYLRCMNKLAAQVAQCFKEEFSREPRLYFSPGRINLIGEHVDYNDGFAMPAAVDKGMYYAVAANHTGIVNFFSFDFKEPYSVALDAVEKSRGWVNYVLSVLNEFVQAGHPVGGFDCVLGGDVPRGSGMSSSAAVEGGLAYAINDFFNCGLSRVQLAQLCQRAEHNYPGVKCGIMDQFANMLGKKEQVVLLDCRSLEYQHFPLQLGGHTIVLLNTKVHHSLASSQYNLRRSQCEEGLTITGRSSFRDFKNAEELEAFRERMSEDVFNRCLFVVQEIDRVQKAAAYLEQGKLTELGQLMYAAHDGLSRLYNVSCRELDFLVEQARLHGITGARMMGGGFGGCTINIVKENEADDFITAAGEAYHKQFSLSPEVYRVGISDGVYRLGAGS
jgi:galactokinase